MGVPTLTNEDVEKIIVGCEVVGNPCKGGQKIVFPCRIGDEKFAIKFIEIKVDEENDDVILNDFIEEIERAKREVRIMGTCKSPYIVKLGPIEIGSAIHKDEKLLYFSEEWIEGVSLKRYINEKKRLDIQEVILLAIHMTKAIDELWGQVKVHRDIKPDNIMYDKTMNRFVMLDLGFALDLEDKSLTRLGMIPCTKTYVSPEQLNLNKKRQLDFRADLFCLGLVLYESYFGIHPFYKLGMKDNEIFRAIIYESVEPPAGIDFELNEKLYSIIKRLLNKKAHQRYRDCSSLINALEELKIWVEG